MVDSDLKIPSTERPFVDQVDLRLGFDDQLLWEDSESAAGLKRSGAMVC